MVSIYFLPGSIRVSRAAIHSIWGTDQKDRRTEDENGTGDSKVVCETGLVFGQMTLWDCLVGKFSQFPAQP